VTQDQKPYPNQPEMPPHADGPGAWQPPAPPPYQAPQVPVPYEAPHHSSGVPAVPPTAGYGYGYGYPPQIPQPPAANGMYVAAAIINWVVLGLVILGTLGLGIIAAAWFIPMTIYIHKGARDTSKHTALGVCTLLFCNIVSGILILVANSNRDQR
jgi:hypothetical protein